MTERRAERFFPLILLWLILFPCRADTAPIASSAPLKEDERQIEAKRESAIAEALAAVDLSLIESKKGDFADVGEIDISGEVNRLRQARKSQFKYLTWSHINETLTPSSVLAKASFLSAHEQNLSRALERAVSVHTPAEVARERMLMAKFRIAKAVRDFLPETTITSDLKTGHLSGLAFISDNWKMRFRQPVFRGGVLWNTLFLEWTHLETAKREYDKTIGDLVADVSEAYFEYERAQNAYADHEKLMVTFGGQKKILDQKYQSKLIPEIEKLNSDSLYSQAQYDLEEARQEFEVARLDVQKFLKVGPSDSLHLSAGYDLAHLDLNTMKGETLPDSGTSQSSQIELERLIEMSYEHRPDLQIEASKLKAAQYSYRAALGKRLPQMDLILEVGELAEAAKTLALGDDPDPGHNTEFKVGMEVTWPFAGNTLKYSLDHDKRAPSITQFASGSGTRTRTHSFSASVLDDLGQFSSMTEAKINRLEQVVELEKTEREVLREVNEAYYSFKKSLIQIDSAFKRMGYRERAAELKQYQVERNEAQISEYLQAEMELVAGRVAVYKALADYFLAKAKLNKAVGIRNYLIIEIPGHDGETSRGN